MLAVPVAVPVPDSRAVPLPLSAKDSPAGRPPDSVIFGVGEPVVLIATAPPWFTVKKAVLALVMAGAVAAFTVMVSARVAVLPEELVADRLTGYVPAVPLAGVPEIVPVPSPLSLNASPDGSAPDSVMVAGGKPV